MSLTYGEQRTEKEKLYDARILEKVQRGMARLEEEYGPDWVGKVNMDELDLMNGDACVLGQVYGSYAMGLEALFKGDHGKRVDQAVAHGFTVEESRQWAGLQQAWDEMLIPIVEKGEENDPDV